MSTPMEPEKQWPMWTVASLLLAATLIVLAMLMCNGCSTTRITDDMVGPTAVTTTTTSPDGTVVVTQKQSAGRAIRESQSSALFGAAQAAEHKAIDLNLDRMEVGGAGGDWISIGGGFGGMFWLGALFCVGGIFFIYKGQWGTAVCCFAVGAGFIFTGFMMERFPVVLLIVLGVVAAGAGYLVWKNWSVLRAKEAAAKVAAQTVKGVEALKAGKPVEERQAINDALKGEQDADVQAAVKALGATHA